MAKPGGCRGRAKKGHCVPRPGPFLPGPGREQEGRDASREQGCGLCRRCQQAWDPVVGPVDRGPLAHCCFVQSRVTAGLGRARKAGAHTPAQLAGTETPSLAWLTQGLM